MYNDVFILLGLLFVKHWYIDFVDQSMDEVNSKGNYGEWLGIRHSLKHGIGTFLVFFLTDISLFACLVLGAIDFILHYHIDWSKININRKKNYTIEMPQFWMWLGADQLAHCITYLFLVWALV
jgi:hypothetical protein